MQACRCRRVDGFRGGGWTGRAFTDPRILPDIKSPALNELSVTVMDERVIVAAVVSVIQEVGDRQGQLGIVVKIDVDVLTLVEIKDGNL